MFIGHIGLQFSYVLFEFGIRIILESINELGLLSHLFLKRAWGRINSLKNQ